MREGSVGALNLDVRVVPWPCMGACKTDFHDGGPKNLA